LEVARILAFDPAIGSAAVKAGPAGPVVGFRHADRVTLERDSSMNLGILKHDQLLDGQQIGASLPA
jgi:hypothetical protein